MTSVLLNRLPISQVFDHLFSDAFDEVLSPIKHVMRRPAANIVENETAYQVELVAPGYTKDDLTIKLDKNLLTISAQKEQNESESVNNFKHREFYLSSFERSFTLPETVDQTAIEAKFENGILKLNLPKKAELLIEPKTISIS